MWVVTDPHLFVQIFAVKCLWVQIGWCFNLPSVWTDPLFFLRCENPVNGSSTGDFKLVWCGSCHIFHEKISSRRIFRGPTRQQQNQWRTQ